MSFSQLLTPNRAALMDCQFLCCSSSYDQLYFVTAHLILQVIKNRYWPAWYLMGIFISGFPLQLARCSLQPKPNPQTVYFSPTYPKQVRNPYCGPPGTLLTPLIRCAFHDVPTGLNRADSLLANLAPGAARRHGLACFTSSSPHYSPN